MHTDKIDSFVFFYINLVLKHFPKLQVNLFDKRDGFWIFYRILPIGQVADKILVNNL